MKFFTLFKVNILARVLILEYVMPNKTKFIYSLQSVDAAASASL